MGKFLTVLFLVTALAGSVAVGGETAASPKVLTVYFSKTGNTQSLAEHVHARVGGDTFVVAPQRQYPAEYRPTTEIARTEQDNDERPPLAATMTAEEMAAYDVVFLGFPIWWGTMPMFYFTFLEQFDWSGKTVIPFATHGGGGINRAPADIQRICKGATVLQPLALRTGTVEQSKADIDAWLDRLGF